MCNERGDVMYPEPLIAFHRFAFTYASRPVLLDAVAVPRLSRVCPEGQSRDVTQCHADGCAVSASCPLRMRTDCGQRVKATRMPSGKAWGKVAPFSNRVLTVRSRCRDG